MVASAITKIGYMLYLMRYMVLREALCSRNGNIQRMILITVLSRLFSEKWFGICIVVGEPIPKAEV